VATAALTGCRIDGSERAGVAASGAAAAISKSTLECNAIDLDGETIGETRSSFEDLGGNGCGCLEESWECKVLSSSLEAHSPLDQPPPPEIIDFEP